MSDYQRIADAIRFLDAHRGEQPDLARVAAEIGLSPTHFHKLFTKWAGATPKDFLQCLTLADARERLRRGESVLASSLDSGLSGPGRLHDLCVTLEAASPGEIKSGGAGLYIRFGTADSPFGRCLIAETRRGICHLSFFDEHEEKEVQQLHSEWPAALFTRDDHHAEDLVNRIFQTSASSTHYTLHVRGTPFQLRVWRALLEIPPGSLVSYGSIARAAGNDRASRATGSAVGRNDISFLIPCHRVIRETGVCGHYRWGALRKRAILAWEGAVESKRGAAEIAEVDAEGRKMGTADYTDYTDF